MFRKLFVSVVFLISTTCGIAAEKTKVQALTLPGHGTINFTVPSSWISEIEQPPNGLPPTITFSQETGPTFRVLITPMWQPRNDIQLPEGNSLQKMVQQSSEEIQKNAANKVTIQRLGNFGYYYFAVDPAPKPGEWANLTQGMARQSVLLLSFTVLTNNGQEHVVAQALRAIETAVHAP